MYSISSQFGVFNLRWQSKKWDSNKLYRHPDYAPVKKESVDPNLEKSEFTHTKRESLEGRDDLKAHDAINIGNLGRVFI